METVNMLHYRFVKKQIWLYVTSTLSGKTVPSVSAAACVRARVCVKSKPADVLAAIVGANVCQRWKRRPPEAASTRSTAAGEIWEG